jgi:hypothetical protein
VTNCTFTANEGGGISNLYSSPTVKDCNFSGNFANFGAGMANISSNPTMTNCSFTSNRAYEYGGGMLNWDNSSPTVKDCNFSGNTTENDGGGMYNYLWSSPTVTNCIFTSNRAYDDGGGMYNNVSSPTVTNCIFTSNRAYDDGGGMYNDASSPTVTNCIFYGNNAEGSAYNAGGGMYNYNNSDPTLTNCTFYSNSAEEVAGGIYNYDNQTVTNCILWYNTGAEIAGEWGTVNYSCLQGTLPPGTGNINADPLFVDAGGGNLRLEVVGSPCVDTGDNNSVPAGVTTDLDGNPRVVDGDRDGNDIVDMGAYELPPPLIINNITQNTWYMTIQAAIDDANDGDEIEVAPRTYNEAINFNGKAVRLYSSGGPEVTTIDGTGNYHVVNCVSGEDANTILEGFTITGGNAGISGLIGGGMYNDYSSPTITDCNCTGNSAFYGGGMYNSHSNPMVTNCTFSENVVLWISMIGEFGYGGGMYNDYSSPTVTNCIFSGNTAMNDGGGMFNYGSSPTVTNCIFHGNEAQGSPYNAGGGMYNYNNSDPTLTNCTFYDNSADVDGGGGIYNYDDQTVTNCILWANVNGQINGNWGTVNYSCLQGSLPPGTGNIDADPCFVSGPLGDYYLSQVAAGQAVNSPCVDAGSDTAANLGMDVFTTRTDGLADGGVVDMGYHYPLPEPWDLNGDGRVSFVDFGILAEQWMQAPGTPSADIVPPDGDGIVDGLDLGLLVDYWLWEE